MQTELSVKEDQRLSLNETMTKFMEPKAKATPENTEKQKKE